MKIKIQLTMFLLLLSIVGYGQALRTIRTYFPYSGGKLSEIYTVINDTGLKHGTYKSYNINGNLDLVMNYNRNLRHGKCIQYDSDRGINIKVNGEYFNDEQHGTWTYYKIPFNTIEEIHEYNKGEYLKRTVFYLNGTKKSVEHFYGIISEWKDKPNNIKGNCCGPTTEWYDNGQKSVEGYKVREYPNGSYWMCKWDGIVKEWYRDGVVKSIVSYTNGVIADSAIYYYPTGILEREIRNDKEGNFKSIYYHSSGVKYQEVKSTPEKNYITIRYDSISHRKIVEFEQSENQYDSKSNKFISKKTYTEDGILDRMTDAEDFIYKYRPDGSVEWKLYPKEIWYTYHKSGFSGTVRVKLNDGTTISPADEFAAGRGKRISKWDEDVDVLCWKYEDYDKTGKLIKKGIIDENNEDIEYTKFKNGKIIERGEKQHKIQDKIDFTIFDDNENISKTGTIDKKGHEIAYVLYENGKMVESKSENGDRFYYNNGILESYSSFEDALLYTCDADESINGILDLNTEANVNFYSNGIIKSKGYLKDGVEVGVWYYYSPKGKLTSVKDNGVERKPTKEEKANHETFLIELIQKKK